MTDLAGLTFKVEWEDPGGVRTPELRATWCRLEMWVGAECISRVEESGTSASRRSVFVPLYPLAEWVAYNWWYLKADRRPSLVPTQEWTFSTLAREHGRASDWLRNHNLRGAGEGFSWPDLTIVPEGSHTRITWKKSRSPRAGIGYIASGDRLLPSEDVEARLTELVELALTRLEETGVRDTKLKEEWDAIQGLDEEEASFAEAAARLGLDPFHVMPEVEESIIEAANNLPNAILGDFLDAANPEALRAALEWVTEASSYIDSVTAPPETDLVKLRSAAKNASPKSRHPWNLGYAQARAVRDVLAVEDTAQFPVERFVSSAFRRADRRELDGYGNTRNGIRLVRGRSSSAVDERFASARGLWHGLSDPLDVPYLLTRARTLRQKTERAFAAELLAPASGLEVLLRDIGPLRDSQDTEELAKRFNVRADVVEYQIENHLNM